MISVVIPARNERFLQNTVTDLLTKSQGDIEVIVVLDGYWPTPALIDDHRVRIIHRGEARGMRAGINAGVAIARGEYILKTDGHCLWDEGYDVKLIADCEKNWVVTPRRKRLDPEKWEVQDVGKPDIDYMYLSYPEDPNDWGGPGLNGKVWEEKNRNESLKSILVDDLMSSQGSAWFMHKDYFYELELMDEDNYGPFWNESQEIFLKAWLSGGRCIVNKKTWYAHLHKGKTYGRGYRLPENWLQQGSGYTRNWLTMGKAWHKQTKPIEWLIEKFGDVPGWPEERKLLPFTPNVFTPPTVVEGKRDKLVELFAQKGFTKGAEVGVSGGRFSEQIMKGVPGVHMIGVDPYTEYQTYKWGGRQERHDNHFGEAIKRYREHKGNLLRLESIEGSRQVEDESLDFVYIDGNHDFDHAMEDIITWSRKVRKGGIVSGHDYYEFRNAGIVDAVNTYVKAHNIKEWFINTERETSWWWVK
jgi:glycosyltransferase involved in cell wall biosynthesis